MNNSIVCRPFFIALLASLVLNSSVSAEEVREKVSFPETDIFLLDLKLDSDSMEISNAKNVTARPGYDNQPYFTKNSESFVFSRDDGYQTDIYEYDIAKQKTERLSRSDNTEFSPTPFLDGSNLAFVTDRSNSIWYASRDELDNPKWVFAENPIHEPIGYFSWNHATGDILYWSQYGFSLTLAHESKTDVHYVSGNAIPSTPHIIPGTNRFSFVHRQANGDAWIKELDPISKAIRPLTPIVGSNANYTWAPDRSIVMIEGHTLYRWQETGSAIWEKISDLTSQGILSASRVAISPNGKRMAIVGLPVESSAVNK
ncbi:MAG: Tol biopolymer transport system component [Arenicella sp.]|jgi:Tol biopolymer transport system component